jgi:ElaB/YqjD/DUF883 family membrane-anchored ribosome-binding protein
MPAANGEGAPTSAAANQTSTAGAAGGGIDANERLPELARRAERAFNENVDRLRTQSREATELANQQLEQARTYVIERVNERPFGTTMAILGCGFLIGLLFAGRRH